MTENHLSDDNLTALYYESGSKSDREHLLQCLSCSQRYGELTETLEALNGLSVPEPNAVEKQNAFQTAWRSSGLNRQKRASGILWPFLRHAASFSIGLACGMMLLAMAVTKSGAKGALSDGDRTKSYVPVMLNGTPAAKVFSELENPVIVVLKEESEPSEQQAIDKNDGKSQSENALDQKNKDRRIHEKRVIEGTTEDGNIQVVWNL